MSARPKMLFVAPRYLLPADSGGKIRTRDILKGLKGGAFEVTLVSPAPARPAAGDAGELASLCDHYACWPENGRSQFFAFGRARRHLSRLPSSVAIDESAAGRQLIASELKREPDLVVVDFPHTAALLPPRIGPASVLFTHNVEAEIFARRLGLVNDPIRRTIRRNQLRKMRSFERDIVRRFDAVIAVSEHDQILFKHVYGVDAATIPTGVDLDYFQFCPLGPDGAGKEIVFTASMDYYPNIDAVRWFMDEVWPLISLACPTARVTIAGRGSDSALVGDAAKRNLPWTFTDFVPDIRPYVQDAAVYIIPLRVGGGTRIKAYEAMAMGRPVVSTSIGIEGLKLEAGQHYLLADTAKSFADSVLQLLSNRELGRRIAQQARSLIERNFSAKDAARQFEGICLETLERRSGRPYRSGKSRQSIEVSSA